MFARLMVLLLTFFVAGCTLSPFSQGIVFRTVQPQLSASGPIVVNMTANDRLLFENEKGLWTVDVTVSTSAERAGQINFLNSNGPGIDSSNQYQVLSSDGMGVKDTRLGIEVVSTKDRQITATIDNANRVELVQDIQTVIDVVSPGSVRLPVGTKMQYENGDTVFTLDMKVVNGVIESAAWVQVKVDKDTATIASGDFTITSDGLKLYSDRFGFAAVLEGDEFNILYRSKNRSLPQITYIK